MKHALGLAVAILLAGIATDTARAGSVNDPHGVGAQALGGVSAPNARLAALIEQGGGVVRSKGVASVSHPSLGQFCIQPSFAVNVARIVPVVSVDWSLSLGDASLVQYRSTGFGCPAGQISVLTFSGEDGSFDLSDLVAFTIYVP